MTKKRSKKQTLTEARENSQLAIVQITEKKGRLTTAEGKELVMTEKFKDWCALFLDKSKADTYGNATQCALKVYSTSNYHSAGQIGYENLNKLEKLGAMVADTEGYGFGDLMKIGIAKMTQGNFSDWKAFMEMLGYFDPKGHSDKQTENTFNFDNLQIAIMRDRKARGLKN